MSRTFHPAQQVSSFRQIAASMWGRPADPTIYGFVDIDVSKTLPFIEGFRERTGQRLTITHIVSMAVARAFGKHRKLNAKVRYWGRIEERESVDVFVSVSTQGGKDLSGTRVDAADTLSLEAFVERLQGRVEEVREGRDKDTTRTKNLLSQVPWWFARPALKLTDVLSNELHLDLPGLGLPIDPFGTAIVTNVGGFGIDTAFAPFVPMGRCPLLLLVTEIKDRPLAVNGNVEVRPVLRLCATFDHRIIDGFQAGQLAREITSFVEEPKS